MLFFTPIGARHACSHLEQHRKHRAEVFCIDLTVAQKNGSMQRRDERPPIADTRRAPV